MSAAVNLYDLNVPRRVILRGEMGERFGREWSLCVNNAKEAIHAINLQRNNELAKYMTEAEDRGIRFAVLIDGQDVFHEDALKSELALQPNPDKEEARKGLRAVDHGLRHPIGMGTLEIVPVVEGSGGDKPWLTILIGVVLIILACVLSLVSGGLGGIFVSAFAGFLYSAIGGIGVSLVVSGVVAMITGPQSVSSNPIGAAIARSDQDSSEQSSERTSKNFSGPVNTTGTGQALPIVLGRLTVGSHLISFGIHSQNDDD